MARPRTRQLSRILDLLGRHPVVGLIGARQVGKTTLARQVMKDWAAPSVRFDLEDPLDASRLGDPMLALRELRGLVVIDEVQRRPDLFEVLRVLADRPDDPARFLVLGSAAPELLQQNAETLAGRIIYHEVEPFRLDERLADPIERLWLRGGFPRSLLAADDGASLEWREAFVRTFLERDLAGLGLSIPPVAARRLWTMVAHQHGGVLNASVLARALGVSGPTVARWLDALTGAMVLRQLQPWHVNLKKRQVKRPKLYVADSGLLHALLGIEGPEDLLRHPVCGASWESFVIDEIITALRVDRRDCYFWATHAGAELDLLVASRGERLGFEIKRTSAPRRSRSMTTASADLALDRLDVVYHGDGVFPLGDGIRAVGVSSLLTAL